METLRMQLDLRGVFTFFSLLLILLLFGGCSVALDKTLTMPQAQIPDSRKFIIAVLPFEHPAPQPDSEEKKPKAKERENRELKQFERNYFSTRLVETLRQSPWVSKAYVTTVLTPSVDFLVKGEVTESDGEVTDVSITLTRCCWKDAFTKTFRADLASSDFKDKSFDPSDMLWNTVANAIGRHFDGVPNEERIALLRERVSAYLERPGDNVSSNHRAVKMIQAAAKWEHENLLGSVSEKALTFTGQIKRDHINWQAKMTKLGEERRDQQLKAGVSTLFMVANVGFGMFAASQGISGASSLISSSIETGFSNIAEAMEESKRLEKAMVTFTEIFSMDIEPQTLKLEGSRVYKLKGKPEEQMKQIRQALREAIALAAER